jgi:hypothetical protein
MNSDKITPEFIENARKQLEAGRIAEISKINEKYDNALLNLEMLVSLLGSVKKMFSNTPTRFDVVNSYAAYDGLTTLKDAVLQIVSSEIKKFETSNTIYQLAALKLKRTLNTETDVKKFKAQVSGLLSFWKAEGKICSYQFTKSKKHTVWGRIEWMNENGKPKHEYFKLQNDMFEEK